MREESAPRTESRPATSTEQLGLEVVFFQESFFVSPYETYDRLRQRDPVFWSAETERWIVTRYDDVATLLNGAQFGTQAKHLGLFRNGFTYMDGRSHARIRKPMNPYFAAKAVQPMVRSLAPIIDEILEAAADRGECDFVRDVANPVSLRMVTALMSLPDEDGPLLARWTKEITAAKGLATTQEAKLRSVESFGVMTRYIREFLDGFERPQGQGHLIAELLQAHQMGGLTADELSTTIMLLIMAAIETTQSLLSSGLRNLLLHPAQLAQLSSDPALVENALEEMLRYDAPAQFINRIARDDLELGGKQIRANDNLLAVIGAANRDPAMFPDPHVFDLQRENARQHLTFGGGVHRCSGASLARQLGQLVFTRLLPYLRRIRPLRTAEDWQRQSLMFRRLESYPVVIEPTTL